MTTQEAKNEIQDEFNMFLEGTGYLNRHDALEDEMTRNEELKRVVEANRMAIRSLEAWEKVKEELVAEIPCYDEVVPFHRGIRKGLEFAINHIDKHLKEVEHG